RAATPPCWRPERPSRSRRRPRADTARPIERQGSVNHVPRRHAPDRGSKRARMGLSAIDRAGSAMQVSDMRRFGLWLIAAAGGALIPAAAALADTYPVSGKWTYDNPRAEGAAEDCGSRYM